MEFAYFYPAMLTRKNDTHLISEKTAGMWGGGGGMEFMSKLRDMAPSGKAVYTKDRQ